MIANGMLSAKYFVSHAGLRIIRMADVDGNNGGCLQLGKCFPNLLLTIALGLGLFSRWKISEDVSVATVSVCAVFALVVSGALFHYFAIDKVICVIRLWFGCLLGYIVFSNTPGLQAETTENSMNILLISSAVMEYIWYVIYSVTKQLAGNVKLMNKGEQFELVGMVIACGFSGRDFVSLTVLVCAFAATIIAIRLRSFLAVGNLIFMVIAMETSLFPDLGMHVNWNALICFASRMTAEPFVTLLLSSIPALDRWQPLLQKPDAYRRFYIIYIIFMEISFYITCAMLIPNHKEWFIVVPFFAVFSMVWLCFHMIFIIILWSLMSKISECNVAHKHLNQEHRRKLSGVFSAKGLRHFSLVSYRLVLCCLLTTVLLSAICWRTKNQLNLSILLLVLPVEMAFLALLDDLGSTLGGTCIGYAVIIPVTVERGENGPAMLLPPGIVDEMSIRCTKMLQAIQRFFAYHLVNSYGCDYSFSGVTLANLRQKVEDFFNQQTVDGPRFDSYILYYSGPTFSNGDWALQNNDRVALSSIQEWWEAAHEGKSRLILVHDTLFSHSWLPSVQNCTTSYIALQTVRFHKANPEKIPMHVGDFTSLWVMHNCDVEWQNWHSHELGLEAAYAVSRCWTYSTLRTPTKDEVQNYWKQSFPSITHSLVNLVLTIPLNSLSMCGLCWCQWRLWRGIRNMKQRYWPPHELQVGHGFKLLKS